MCKPKTSIPDISGSVEGFMEKTDSASGETVNHSNFSTGDRKKKKRMIRFWNRSVCQDTV
jgi:hypothetical protein